MQGNRDVILITGSTDGIGLECALELAKAGATVIVHGRSASKGNETLELLKRQSQNDNVGLVVADFASLAQVRTMADDIRARYSALNVLVNNAGTYSRTRQMTEDGFEATFAVNHLAPFLLTNLLLELLKQNAPTKVINVSSMVHQQARIDESNLMGEKQYDAYGAYAVSKLANLLFTYELAKRLEGIQVTVNALHPGVIGTKLLRAGFGSFAGKPVAYGAARILNLINVPGSKNVSGKYFVDDKEAVSSQVSRDQRIQKEFWLLSEKLAGMRSA